MLYEEMKPYRRGIWGLFVFLCVNCGQLLKSLWEDLENQMFPAKKIRMIKSSILLTRPFPKEIPTYSSTEESKQTGEVGQQQSILANEVF